MGNENVKYGGIDVGRGRPRGNRTQRDIGRAVGKGLKGKKPPQFDLTTLI